MVSTDTLTPPAGPHRAETSPDRSAEPGSRGALTIAHGVVEKIAAAVLAEVDQLGGPARRVLGVPLGAAAPDRLPQVEARVSGEVVTLEVRCSVAYPAPVARVTDRARVHLVDRLAELTGLVARQVDITVTALPEPSTSQRRMLQ